ncbi:MAG TPA: 6,7-dimethyl-8-ribityllumazine synthase [Xanthomonadales bacterium]|nr:6,7-dimethyl-8-ribityllumazine synthase [Xanthomonadales bacterium]
MTQLDHIAGAGTVDLDRHEVTRLDPVQAAAVRVAIVAARFNAAVVDALAEGAIEVLAEAGLSRDAVTLVRVPGAWELPVAAAWLARGRHCDAIVALGCVVRGETSHYDVIVNESARGLAHVALETGVPVANGVLACEDEAQARARSGPGEDNKGREAARAALAMAALKQALA